jgi:hypothetical protein
MNALFIASRFEPAAAADLSLKAPGLSRGMLAPSAPARRNRYVHRAFGVGYGSSQGYAKARTYLATPSLSRYR